MIQKKKKKVTKRITDKMGMRAHVSVQTWRGWDPNDLFEGWFSALGGFKILIGAMGLILKTCLKLSCLVPLVLWSIKTIIKAIIKRKMAAYAMML
jgi:hypothetical protein